MSTFYQRHGRAKPPKIWGGGWDRDSYEFDHPHVLTIFNDRDYPLWAIWSQGNEICTFPTHAEAITWAQKHARQ